MRKDSGIKWGIFLTMLLAAGAFLFETYDYFHLEKLTCESKTIIQKEMIDSGTKDRENYIQAAHVDFEYSCGNGGLIIKDVICSRDYKGSSNQPSMFTGNTPIYIPYDDARDRDRLREGQFVRYLTKDSTTMQIHRITALYPAYLRVQGDNNAFDEKIDYKDITDVIIGILHT